MDNVLIKGEDTVAKLNAQINNFNREDLRNKRAIDEMRDSVLKYSVYFDKELQECIKYLS